MWVFDGVNEVCVGVVVCVWCGVCVCVMVDGIKMCCLCVWEMWKCVGG